MVFSQWPGVLASASPIGVNSFGGYSIKWTNKGKTLLLINKPIKLGFLLSMLIAYCSRYRGRGLITFWNGSVRDWLGGLSGNR